MTQEGRNLLFRVELHAARHWGAALEAHHEAGVPRGIPFGELAWYETLRTLRLLKRGVKV